MNRFVWWPLHYRKLYHSAEPGAALFAGIRLRLTLWYCGVVAAILVLFGVALYAGAQFLLLTPIENDTAGHANFHVSQWVNGSPDRACSSSVPSGPFGPPPSTQGPPRPEMVACFDRNGSLLQNGTTGQLPAAFLSTNLVKTALQHGKAVDIVDAGGTIGLVYRYALVVPSPTGSGSMGVVLVGESVQAQESALSVLLLLLISVGGVTLLVAGVGGMFLANRALAPARLSWANQQRFIADASHELRTPLTLLRADAEVLLRSRKHLATEDAALLEDIVAETEHMGKLANNLLTLARLDAGSTHREYDVVSLADLTQQAIRRVKSLADQKELLVQGETADAPFVIGDPVLLEQAVIVLLDNAIKYNRQGGQVVVRTVVKEKQALLEVCDTGVGIAAEHLPHLGERFYRVDKARSREAGGTGLGLSIAQSIIIAHGGTLRLSSTPDQGTVVTLTLPLAHRAAPDRRDDVLEGMALLPEQKD